MESGIIDDGLPFKSLDSVCFDYQDRRTFARQSSIFCGNTHLQRARIFVVVVILVMMSMVVAIFIMK